MSTDAKAAVHAVADILIYEKARARRTGEEVRVHLVGDDEYAIEVNGVRGERTYTLDSIRRATAIIEEFEK